MSGERRDALAEVMAETFGGWLFQMHGQLSSCDHADEGADLADVALAHIRDELSDPATVEAVARGVYNAVGRRETGREWADIRNRPVGSYFLGIAEGLIAVVAHQIGAEQ